MIYDIQTIDDAVAAHQWILTNAEPSPDNCCPIFSPGALHRSSVFSKRPRAELDKALDALQHEAVISASEKEPSGGGRHREIRKLNMFFVPGEGMDILKMAGVVRGCLTWEADAKAASEAPHSVAVAYDEPQPAAPSQDANLRFLRDTPVSFGGAFVNYNAGAVVSDFHLKQHLLDAKMPVVPVDNTNTCNCPKCSKFFDVTFDDGTQHDPVLIVLADVRYHHNGSLMQLSRGDLLQDHHTVARLLAEPVANIVLAGPADFARCPSCKFVFPRTAVMGASYGRPS